MDIRNDKAKALFAARLSELLRRKGMKQNELARVLDVAESTVGKWLLRKAMPKMGVIQRIADHFCVGKSFLLEEDASFMQPAQHVSQQSDAQRLHVVAVLRGLQANINALIESAIADVMQDGETMAEKSRRIEKESGKSETA